MTDYIKVEKDIYKGKQAAWKETFGLQNFLQRGSVSYQQAQDLAQQHKVIDGYDSTEGYVVKDLSEADFGDALNFEGVYYTLEVPAQIFDDLSTKLLVWFAPFHEQFDVPAQYRMFCKPENRWPTLGAQTANNTYILRIADSNLMSGSFFQNTPNFPTYEEKVQALIKSAIEKIGLAEDSVILYGDGRGGTGALLHAILGNYTALAVDPILNRNLFYQENFEATLTDGILPLSFVGRFNELLKSRGAGARNIKILSSDSLTGTYPSIKSLDLTHLELQRLNFHFYNPLTPKDAHTAFVTENQPLILSFLNNFLYSKNLSSDSDSITDYTRFWDVELPQPALTFSFHYLKDGFQLTRNSKNYDTKVYFQLKHPLKAGGRYMVAFLVEKGGSLSKIALAAEGDQNFTVDLSDHKPEPRGAGEVWFFSFLVGSPVTALALDPLVYSLGWQIKLKGVVVREL